VTRVLGRAQHLRVLGNAGGAPPRFGLLSILLLTLATAAFAVEPDEILQDRQLEHRARAISTDLRCLVCQNQSIDESDAPLAKDLRVLVRERLRAGETDAQVRDFVVQRYGEFVLLRPRFGRHTALLWLTPLLVVGLGALGLGRALRRARPSGPARLTEDEEKALRALLAENRAAEG
jgi:cytochrome c-type biogenesis protein CcmH